MALNLARIEEYLAAESPWSNGFNVNNRHHGQLSRYAPMWAQVAMQMKPMIPRLEGRLATARLTDWHLLALWCCWMGPRFREAEAGQQLVATVESGWGDFKAWVWQKFGT